MSSPSFYTTAGNFIDTIQGGVDPRTGLFNISLPLMRIHSGNLAGPVLALGLKYSPLSLKDEGFGKGFSLNLTRYYIISQTLVLSTGEEYRISPSGNNVRQKKLKSFIFEKIDESTYQIIYKTGLVERLIRHDSLFVTSLIIAPSGRYLSFDWDASFRLTKVNNDDNSVICKITYANDADSSTTLSVLPNDPKAHYDILLKYHNGYINSASLPTDNGTLTWRLEYEPAGPEKNNDWVLTSVSYPTGALEQVFYNFSGMLFPDNINKVALPCVTQHTFYPGGEQPLILTKWEWTSSNYLGQNLINKGWVWNIDPLLIRLDENFRYGSTAKIIASDGSSVLSSVTRSYNSYHLLVSENTLRDGKLYKRITNYNANPGSTYDEQPQQYLLPVSLEEHWDGGEGKPARTSLTYWEYDPEGNLLREERPDGSVTKCVYYPAGGEKGCPADPHGFTRYLKSMTVTPPRLTGDEPSTISIHTWQSLGAGNQNHVVPNTVVETSGKMQTEVSRIYNIDTEDSLIFGREVKRITILTPDVKAGTSFTNTQIFNYEIAAGELLQSETLKTHDGLTATYSTLRHSSTGYLISETDAQGIRVNHTYDSLGRMLSRTEADGTDYARRTLWSYAMEGSGHVMLETDAAGNQTKIFFDGLGREVRQQRLDKDRTQEWFEVLVKRYNILGETTFSLSSDWVTESKERSSIGATISYDGWGNISEQAFTDDIRNLMTTDPVALTQISSTKGTVSGQTVSNGTLTTILDNKSLLPVTVTRKNASGGGEKVRHYEWDGLKRRTLEKDEMGRETKWGYDESGRILTQTLADGTLVTRTYAPHLTGNEIASISVTGKDSKSTICSWLLGIQEFDGLGRLTKRISGGRTTSYTYQGASPEPSEIRMPSGKILKYTYIPELGNAVNSLIADGVVQTFNYDKATGQMLKAEEGSTVLSNTLYPSGNIKAESFAMNGGTKNTTTISMLGGGIIQYNDISGKNTRYVRDNFGQVSTINDDVFSSSLEYDALGRLNKQVVTDDVTKSTQTTTKPTLTTELEYDDFGQEITRTINDSIGDSLKISQIWNKNGLLAGRITLRNNLEIRNEHYSYDVRNRLRLYKVTGSSLPHNSNGDEITTQLFEYDSLNNLTILSTTLSNYSIAIAVYNYENSNDPTQLTSVEYDGDPSKTLTLEYDTDGNMVKDGAKHTLNYDALGRLSSLDGYIYSSSYHYDALNRLVSQNINNYSSQFYYRDGQLVSKMNTQWNNITRLIRNGSTCIGMSLGNIRTLMAADQNECVLWSRETDLQGGVLHTWPPYGSRGTTSTLPGFNGEMIDPVSGVYHLGNGYRAYNPLLMRFHCPDNLSPFGAGGINAYAYCAGDPINFTDPTGHISGWGIAGIVLGSLGLILTGVIAGIAIAAAGSVGAAIGAASATTLVVGGLTVVADVTSIASGATEDSYPLASSALGWASLYTGVGAFGLGITQGVSGWLRNSRSLGNQTRGGLNALSQSRKGAKVASKNATALGDDFYLYRAEGMRADKLLITAHGGQSLTPLRTRVPKGSNLNFYANEGYRLKAGLEDIARQKAVARQTVSGGAGVRNYNLSRFSETEGLVEKIVRRHGVDVVTVRNRARAALYPADLDTLFRSLQSSNISYKHIDAVFCRENWLGIFSPVQTALPV